MLLDVDATCIELLFETSPQAVDPLYHVICRDLVLLKVLIKKIRRWGDFSWFGFSRSFLWSSLFRDLGVVFYGLGSRGRFYDSLFFEFSGGYYFLDILRKRDILDISSRNVVFGDIIF